MESANLGNARTIYSVVLTGIANGDIDVPATDTNNTTTELSELVEKGLLDVEPKPQGKGDNATFTYTIDKDGNVKIYIGNEVIYPEGNSK